MGHPETTLVAGDRYLALAPTGAWPESGNQDLLVAFGVDPALYKARNAYVISDQGKPPDQVLEVASPSTSRVDVGEKRVDYAALGIQEYWRFDETGEHHGRDWPATAWWTACTCQFPQRNWTTACTRVTARYCICARGG